MVSRLNASAWFQAGLENWRRLGRNRFQFGNLGRDGTVLALTHLVNARTVPSLHLCRVSRTTSWLNELSQRRLFYEERIWRITHKGRAPSCVSAVLENHRRGRDVEYPTEWQLLKFWWSVLFRGSSSDHQNCSSCHSVGYHLLTILGPN